MEKARQCGVIGVARRKRENGEQAVVRQGEFHPRFGCVKSTSAITGSYVWWAMASGRQRDTRPGPSLEVSPAHKGFSPSIAVYGAWRTQTLPQRDPKCVTGLVSLVIFSFLFLHHL